MRPETSTGGATRFPRGRCRARCPAAWLAIGLVALLASGAGAVPDVFVQPDVVSADPEDVFELSVRMPATGDSIASYQLYLSFDPDVVELTDAQEGTLYVFSGYMTWPRFEEVSPGFWHFFDTLMGVGSYIEPPGEILRLTFQALADGETETSADTLRMTDVRREAYPVVTFDPATITVPGTGIEEVQSALLRVGPATPNPFSVGTTIAYAVPLGTSGWRAGIYDVSGRSVRTLAIPAGSTGGDFFWDGRSDAGEETAAGVYLLRLTGAAGETSTRLVKLR